MGFKDNFLLKNSDKNVIKKMNSIGVTTIGKV